MVATVVIVDYLTKNFIGVGSEREARLQRQGIERGRTLKAILPERDDLGRFMTS